ncbi:hypothetical protein GPAL_3143 [Glaciecola pallidula DSM 14239 = ACAM 615]|uniref:Uncharacterized protein n=1 Tax=Brumicola pallidula DSM 14239 = ACAM 615 TaxID=1121922 RepID=K6YB73_9ALTE|nr:hypothetical protein GPAL_3143 [Glaciecola pallidula DSM 14239 = ACAM 615]
MLTETYAYNREAKLHKLSKTKKDIENHNDIDLCHKLPDKFTLCLVFTFNLRLNID